MSSPKAPRWKYEPRKVHELKDGRQLFISPRPDVENLQELHKAGIRHIVAVVDHPEVEAEWKRMGGHYTQVSPNAHITENHAAANNIVRAWRGARGNLLVFCDQGVHKSPTYAYVLLRAKGIGHSEAAEIVKRGLLINQHLDRVTYYLDSEGRKHKLWD